MHRRTRGQQCHDASDAKRAKPENVGLQGVFKMHAMTFQVDGAARRFGVRQLIVAGWTGRDRDAVEHHVAELEAIGVRRPGTIPCFYRLGAALLTTAIEIEVVGDDSSGEVEFVLLSADDGLYVGIGSDHTDRKVEAYGVTVSKQMCPKPVGPDLWRLADVQPHWDRLTLRSHVTRSGTTTLYQEGAVTKMLAPRELLAKFPDSPGLLSPGTAMFCGTLPVNGEIAGGEKFAVELHDPVCGRRLQHEYRVHSLPIAD
jgi:hypothetical protein